MAEFVLGIPVMSMIGKRANHWRFHAFGNRPDTIPCISFSPVSHWGPSLCSLVRFNNLITFYVNIFQARDMGCLMNNYLVYKVTGDNISCTALRQGKAEQRKLHLVLEMFIFYFCGDESSMTRICVLLRSYVVAPVGPCRSRLIRHHLVPSLPIVILTVLVFGCEATASARRYTAQTSHLTMERMEETNKLSSPEDRLAAPSFYPLF
ncbi:hypothetical protein HD554DRAFT_1827224 [Boletus coccyginus]|nr:hypothetical protein HD554DRAFT_1827224 [Boletus coccyginus]